MSFEEIIFENLRQYIQRTLSERHPEAVLFPVVILIDFGGEVLGEPNYKFTNMRKFSLFSWCSFQCEGQNTSVRSI